MYTRWRLYILAVFLIALAACLILVKILRKRGHSISRLQCALFTAGTLFVLETVIVLGLSNFNLGVILPGCFGVPMILLAFLLPAEEKGFARFLKRLIVIGFGCAIVIFLVCGLLMFTSGHSAEKTEGDAVIVLGAAVHGEKVTWVLENRLETAAVFLRKNPSAVCVVSGGQGAGESVTEASAMKKYLVERCGIAEERVLAEEQATNTRENFRFSMEVLENASVDAQKLAYVTTDFHVYRAGRVAKAQGLDITGIKAPDVWYLRLNNFMRESVAICVYSLTGAF